MPLTLDLDVDLPRHVLGGDGEVYVTADDELVVLDLDGAVLGSIEDLPGAGPMALSPDGESLFLGLQGSIEVVVFDVEDLLEVWSWELSARPRSLLATDEFLQVGVGTAGTSYDRTALVTILADEEAEPIERTFSHTPILARDDAGLVGDGRHVAAGRRGSGGYDVTIHRLGDAGTTVVAAYDLPGQLVTQGLSLTSDGTLAILTNPSAGSGSRGGWLTLVPDPHLADPELLLDGTSPIAGQPIVVNGHLRDPDGTPVHGADITVVDPRGGQHHVTTDGAGGFTAALDASPVGISVEGQVVFSGDDQRRPAIVQQTLTPRRGANHPDLDGRTYIAGRPSIVHGRVLGEPAMLRPNIPVMIEVDGQVRGTVLSGADGFYNLPLTGRDLRPIDRPPDRERTSDGHREGQRPRSDRRRRPELRLRVAAHRDGSSPVRRSDQARPRPSPTSAGRRVGDRIRVVHAIR